MNYGAEVVSAVLDQLGIEVDDPESESWANALCPMHEDRKPSFAIHMQEGGWICRAGCGSSPDLASLVQRLEGGEIKQIQIRLRNMFIDDIGLIARALVPKKREEELDEFPEPLFYERGKIYPYILKRGFTKETLKKWDVGIDSQIKAIVIPIYYEGKLVGLYRRGIKGKWFQNSLGLKKKQILFGLDHIPDTADYVVVVEGALDALWLHQQGYWAVATLGGTLTDEHTQILLKRFNKIILAFDNPDYDKAGAAFTREAYGKLIGKVGFVDSMSYPSGKKDVQECTATELAFYLGGMI